MEGLAEAGTEFARMVAASHACRRFTLFDVGCSGGIDLAWRCFGDKLVAFGFDANVTECERLASIETNSSVQYVKGFVGPPAGHEFLKMRGRRASLSGSPWGPSSTARSIEIRRQRAGKMSQEQLRDMNLWAETRLADPSRPVVLADFATSRQITDVDFIKIDVDGEDLAILHSIVEELDRWQVLGLGLEVNFFGSGNDTDHTFHNTDRLMRRHGFDLFNLSVRRYSYASLPSKYTWHNPSETFTGKPTQGDAIYLRDVCSDLSKPGCRQLDDQKLLKLAAVGSLAWTPDLACEILSRFRDRIGALIDLPHARNLLARQAQEQLGVEKALPYTEYMDAFAADAPLFYTVPPA